jgi:hypothetical protein
MVAFTFSEIRSDYPIYSYKKKELHFIMRFNLPVESSSSSKSSRKTTVNLRERCLIFTNVHIKTFG